MPSWRIIAPLIIACLVASPNGIVSIDDSNEGKVDFVDMETKEKVINTPSSMRGSFTENKGQIENSDVKYVYTGSDMSIGFIEIGYLIKLTNKENLTSLVTVRFQGANRVSPEGRGELSHKSNYFKGNDSSKWRTGVPNYEKVVYENLYDGIDLVYYFNEKGLKYDWIIKPYADPSVIAKRFQGIESLHIDSYGALLIQTLAGELREDNPYCYQAGDERNEVKSSFRTLDTNIITYDIGEYDRTLPLIIDPLIYSTYVGGGGSDNGNDIAVDSDNNAYVTGFTWSNDFPTTDGSYDMTYHDWGDVFVLKLSPYGDELIYSTYVGGESNDYGLSLAVDNDGNTYVSGWTLSYDFPTTSGAYDRIWGGNRDAFVFKLNADGSDLVYSTFVGGVDADDSGRDLALDSDTNAYVTGPTGSDDFPTTNGVYDDSHDGEIDTFVFKLNTEGSDLVYSTFLGGAETEIANAITLDEENNVYVTGDTESDDFPTTDGAYDESINGGRDIFISKLNADGSDLVYSTFVGGYNWEMGNETALDSNKNVYVTGFTFSEDFPVTDGAYDTSYEENREVFVLKLKSDGSDLVFSTYITGNYDESGNGIKLDRDFNVYVTGTTDSSEFPTTSGAYDKSYNGKKEVFVLKLNPDGSRLLYSTFVGGGHNDNGFDIVLDSEDNAYITGSSSSDDFPTTEGAFDDTSNGYSDVIVFKLELTSETNLPTPTIISPTDNSTISGTITVRGTVSNENDSIERVEVSIDGSGWQYAIGTTSWSFTWYTETVENGVHTIQARCYDGTDYSDEVGIKVVVDNTDDSDDSEWYEESIFTDGVLVVIIVVVVAVVYLFVRKRNMQDYDEWDDEEYY